MYIVGPRHQDLVSATETSLLLLTGPQGRRTILKVLAS